jgi:hypothetical protein
VAEQRRNRDLGEAKIIRHVGEAMPQHMRGKVRQFGIGEDFSQWRGSVSAKILHVAVERPWRVWRCNFGDQAAVAMLLISNMVCPAFVLTQLYGSRLSIGSVCQSG